ALLPGTQDERVRPRPLPRLRPRDARRIGGPRAQRTHQPDDQQQMTTHGQPREDRFSPRNVFNPTSDACTCAASRASPSGFSPRQNGTLPNRRITGAEPGGGCTSPKKPSGNSGNAQKAAASAGSASPGNGTSGPDSTGLACPRRATNCSRSRPRRRNNKNGSR